MRCPDCGAKLKRKSINVTPKAERRRLMHQFRTPRGRRYQDEHNEGPADFGDYIEAWVCDNCDYTETV